MKNIFGKKYSIQRLLIIGFVLAVSFVIILTVSEFFIFIEPAVKKNNLIIIESQSEFNAIVYILRKSLSFATANIIIVSIILMKIYQKKLSYPISKINDATKKVTKGEYNIELETTRKDEIGELTENFNKMIKGLQSTENLQKEFINNVSHEIKTPISSIEGFAKFLKEDNLSKEEREEYSNIIIEESERLSNLTSKMLKLSKLHNQEIIVNKQEIMVAEQIRKAISVLEHKWSQKDIKINVSLQEIMILGDEDLIFQVWMNLIENAIKFSKQNGKIDIKLIKEKSNIIVTIKDYGIGMSEDELEKIFERFYQIDKSHSEEGSGLGLAIVKRIIELSNGSIRIESKENKGTIVTVQLPAFNKDDNKVYI